MDNDQGITTEEAEQVGSIGRKAGRGLRWTLFATLATKVGSFAMSLVLARLLVPADFGLYAIALAATQFVMHVNDVGIIAATVQWRGKLEDMAATASLLAILFSAGWYAIFWVAAPSFAELAGSAEATPLVRLLTAVILIDGVTAVRVAALQRRFQHDKLMLAITAGFVVNASLAITLAANGAGPYSFVIGQVSASVVTGTLVLFLARLPLRYRWDRAIAARLVRFGWPLAAGLGVESILVYADSVIVGNALGATALGFYLLAFNVSSWVPGLITTAVRYVSISGFSRLAEQKGDSLSLGVQRSVPLLVSAVLPIAVLMGVLAPALVVFLYGGDWAPAAAALRFLAVVTVARVLLSFTFDVLTSLGATRSTVWLNLGWAVTLVPALIFGTNLGGIRGAAMAHAVIAVAVAIPLAVLALHRAGVRLGPIAPALARPVLGGALAATVMVGLTTVIDGSPFVELCLAGGAGLVAYVLVVVPRDALTQLAARRGA
jgi:O-antigen/teichoic acid export membrane protein